MAIGRMLQTYGGTRRGLEVWRFLLGKGALVAVSVGCNVRNM